MDLYTNEKALLKTIGFTLQDGKVNVWIKKFQQHSNCILSVDFENKKIDFGDLIKLEGKTTSNFSQAENWVVLECVNRLLEKGYQPQNIVLEKTWATGHGTSGRLDILVARNNGTSYLMIECKTYGIEFEKEFKRLKRDGGQLFTYFQQDKNADVLMLYASKLGDVNTIEYCNEIIKIEDEYRQTGNVRDFYERWNKLPKNNGIFESWVELYDFQSKALTKKDLRALKQEDSSFIFNRFLEILRHNVVSDKPNAFNKIFTLFLCKIVDENRNDDEQLHFQWLEGEDDHIRFQKRLTDLYNRGMLELLEKKVTDVSDSEFDRQFQQVEERHREKFKEILTEIRLKKNNEFAIKEVYDDASFYDNAKVVKEIVELLQKYQLRYNYRQQFLSDFFELLLTTGLKQESGQFFTPVPVARFIIKSLPLREIIESKLQYGNKSDLLPTVIDYAAGSGHFITESMEEIQKHLDVMDEKKYLPITQRAIKKWKDDQFDWAEDYIYAIEKDYRLVKTAKVSCYLHGDGLAKVIHGDGLGDFQTSKEFKDRLKGTDRTYPQDNKQFDVVISNPPYSVSAFKGTMMDEDKARRAFNLYARLTDQSSEIECLFVERTKQLLKDGGIAGIVLPSSILSNTGIYTQAREIILQYFEIIAIAELGSGTFMATGTNTVVLFLRRRNNADAANIKASVERFFVNMQDVTANGIESPIRKYVDHVWESISFEDYVTLLKGNPNEIVQKHALYQDYNKKIKARTEQEKTAILLSLEQEKIWYFILVYHQKLVLVKSGEKDAEKRFLGYEFSNRRGNEGIHPIQRGKSIEECTQMFDAEIFNNPEKASTYIYQAFQGNFDGSVHPTLSLNIIRQNLVDMITFDRVDFEKVISLAVKKKVKIESRWKSVKLEHIANIRGGDGFPKEHQGNNNQQNIPFLKVSDMNLKENSQGIIAANNYISQDLNTNHIKANVFNIGTIIFPKVGRAIDTNKKSILKVRAFMDNNLMGVSSTNKDILLPAYLFLYFTYYVQLIELASTANPPSISAATLKDFKIPLPPKDVQEKIVEEIEVLEIKVRKAKKEINELGSIISRLINETFSKYEHTTLGNICDSVEYGSSSKSQKFGKVPVIRMGNIQNGKIYLDDLVYTDDEKEIDKYLLKENDILFNRTNSPEHVGKVGIFKGKSPAIFAGYLIRINYKKEFLTPVFLVNVLNSETIRNYGFSVMSKSVNQANINGSILKTYKIPLPPLQEQQKIVAEIEHIENQIASLEKELEAIPKQKEEILNKYLY